MKVETDVESRNREYGRQRAESAGPKRALVVDDQPAMCELIDQVLKSAGIEAVSVATSAEDADEFHGQKFDVILVDLSMRPEDGVELVRKIRGTGLNRMTPIIMISDDQRPGSLSQGFEAGASFFLHKPIDRARLVKLIGVSQGAIEHERRRFRRIPLRAKVRLKSANTQLEGETIDVSLNGTMVRAPRVFPVGSLVEVSLYLAPAARPVVGLGSVMRVIGTDQMGILLDGLSVSESDRLQEHLLPLITG